MDFDDYAGWILHTDKAREGTNKFAKKNKQALFPNKKGNMYMFTIEKSEFGQLNNKRYLSCDAISSLPYGYQDLMQ